MKKLFLIIIALIFAILQANKSHAMSVGGAAGIGAAGGAGIIGGATHLIAKTFNDDKARKEKQNVKCWSGDQNVAAWGGSYTLPEWNQSASKAAQAKIDKYMNAKTLIEK